MARRASLAVAALTLALLGYAAIPPRVGRAAPTTAVTRAQFVLELAGQLHLTPLPGAQQVFKDVPPGDPDFGTIMAAYRAGWISGFPDGTFRPGVSLTREQIAKAEVLALGLQSAALSLSAKTPAYSDAGWIGRWAWGYINEAAAIGILRGFSGNVFGPQQVFTQAEIVHAQAQLATYLASAPVQAFSTAPSASAGKALGTTSITVTPNLPGDHVAASVSQGAIAPPTGQSPLPSGAAPYTSGANLAVAPGEYVGLYEENAAGSVVAFSQLQVSGGDVLQEPSKISLTGSQGGPASASAALGPYTLTLRDVNGNASPAPQGGVTVYLSSPSQGQHEFSKAPSGVPATSVTIPAGSDSAQFYYGDEKAGAPMLTGAAAGLSAASMIVQITAAQPSRVAESGPPSGMSATQALIGPFTVSLSDAFENPRRRRRAARFSRSRPRRRASTSSR